MPWSIRTSPETGLCGRACVQEVYTCLLLGRCITAADCLPAGARRVTAKQPKKKKKKSNMGVGESFTFLAKSPYIRDLALLVRWPFCKPCRALGPARRQCTRPEPHAPPLQELQPGIVAVAEGGGCRSPYQQAVGGLNWVTGIHCKVLFGGLSLLETSRPHGVDRHKAHGACWAWWLLDRRKQLLPRAPCALAERCWRRLLRARRWCRTASASTWWR